MCYDLAHAERHLFTLFQVPMSLVPCQDRSVSLTIEFKK